jgi:hypothetical protein
MLRTMMETYMPFNHLEKWSFLALEKERVFLTSLKYKYFWDTSDLRYTVDLRFFSKTAV